MTEPAPDGPTPLLAGRYRLGERFDVRAEVERCHGTLVGPGGEETPVVMVREYQPDPIATQPHPPRWPGLAWEDDLTRRAKHLGLPRVLDTFAEGSYSYLVFESPSGHTFWDVWDDPSFGPAERYGWLAQLAELLQTLHNVGAVLESLSPSQVHISPLGQVLLDATVILLPVPLPAKAPVRPELSSAPELFRGAPIDARSDLYCFGALLYALELGHELSDPDFRAPGDPKPFLERFPDAHPFLGRLLSKTLQPDRDRRFPTGGAADDISGFGELWDELRQAQRALGRVRFDLAAWTSTGMVRPGNEDTFALVHATEASQNDTEEYALVLLADGMGGSAAGEVAAALAVQTMRHHLMTDLPFRALADDAGPLPAATDRGTILRRLEEALQEANRRVYLAARQDERHHGMGCTAEAVYLDGRQLLIGHVGDSRTYHLHRGQLRQVTRDQTVVGRLIELGQLTPEEAEVHPRRCELREAIGGRIGVDAEFFSAPLSPGDWVVVCSDGLTAALRPVTIQNILERCSSAEQAARRLVNWSNLAGAPDNVTVVVVRAT